VAEARIALDAMGGDRAPQETVKGASEAVERDPELVVILVGDRDRVQAELDELGVASDRLVIQHASQVVNSSDAPVEALRAKRDASIAVASRMVAGKEVHALVAAGSTGAAVAAGTLLIKLLPGVRRPGIAVTMPARQGKHTILCDAGANITCKPLHLYHYGIMAARYAERILGVSEPRVGLMNVGSEEVKGTSLVRETAELFSRASLNYVGHIEGNDVFTGEVDVIVCEGFVGNVVLKVSEGLFDTIYGRFQEVAQGVREAQGADMEDGLKGLMNAFKRRMDWAEHGGAPLLGLNGLVLISHGRSDARAIRNAILQAAHQHRSQVLEAMAEDLRAS